MLPNLKKPWDRRVGEALEELIDPTKNPLEAFNDNKLAKLGDALMNFIYSLSLSHRQGIADGRKVPNLILAKALDSARHRDLVPKRSDKHRKGDIVEAIFAYAWLKRMFDIREASVFLARRHQTKENGLDLEGYAKALAEFLNQILIEMGIPEDV